jgi:hypothetical protein
LRILTGSGLTSPTYIDDLRISTQHIPTSKIYTGPDLSYVAYNDANMIPSRTITENDIETTMSILPQTAVNIQVSSWTTNSKTWTESSDTHDTTTMHTIGGFTPNTRVDMYIDGVIELKTTSSSAGIISFIYTGGFVDDHVFELTTLTVYESGKEQGSDNIKIMFGTFTLAIIAALVLAGATVIGVLSGKVEGAEVPMVIVTIVSFVIILLIGMLILSKMIA